MIHRRGPWRSLEAVEFATLEWVNWFNHRRLLEPIGNIPPAEAEARYYEQRGTLSVDAWASDRTSHEVSPAESRKLKPGGSGHRATVHH